MRVLLVLLICCFCISIASDGDFFVRSEAQKSAVPPPAPLPMIYDDGTPVWFTWAGNYRAVWFDLNDFVMEPPVNYYLTSIEIWFYHDTSYPWDTSSFSCEIWNGDLIGPVELFETQNCVAQHYSPVTYEVEELFWIENCFWTILDLSQSAGGWPSLLCDNTPQTGISHSYFSNDFIIWEPWNNDESISQMMDLSVLSWGNLKTLF